MKSFVDIMKETYKEWNEHKAPRLGAALAYYTVFSLAPLLLLIIRVAASFFGKSEARGAIVHQVQGLMGGTVATAVKEMVTQAHEHPASGVLATIIGLVTLLAGASGIFGQLQDSLNTIWEVAPRPGRGFLATLKDRFLSYAMVLGCCFVLMVSLVISTAVSSAGKLAGGILHFPPWIEQVVTNAVSLLVIAIVFAMIFKVLPDVKIDWSDVWMGALLTSLLFTIGKFALGIYLGKSSPGSAYGAAGSLVALMLWVYYAAQIVLFGAEFTRVYAQRCGSRLMPSDNAVAVTPEEQARQGMPDSATLEAAARSQDSETASSASRLTDSDGSRSNGGTRAAVLSSSDGSRADSTPTSGRRESKGRPEAEDHTAGLHRARPAPVHPDFKDKDAVSEYKKQSRQANGSGPALMETTAQEFRAVVGDRAAQRPVSAEPLLEDDAFSPPASPAPEDGLAGMAEAINDARTRRRRAVMLGAAAALLKEVTRRK